MSLHFPKYRSHDTIFLNRHGWGWFENQHTVVDKYSGRVADITMVGIVDSCKLDVWSDMDPDIYLHPRSAQQWLELVPPEDPEFVKQYSDAVVNLNKMLTIASERWPCSGYMVTNSHQRFHHTVFRDRGCETRDKRAKHKQDFRSNLDLFHPPEIAESALRRLSKTHSLETLHVHYKGQMIYPRYWDQLLPKATVRITFEITHKAPEINRHIFSARMTDIFILESFMDILPEMRFGECSDNEDDSDREYSHIYSSYEGTCQLQDYEDCSASSEEV